MESFYRIFPAFFFFYFITVTFILKLFWTIGLLIFLMYFMILELRTWHRLWKKKAKQRAFRERRHLHVCDIWPWHVILTLQLTSNSRIHWLSDILYIFFCNWISGMTFLILSVSCLCPFVEVFNLWPWTLGWWWWWCQMMIF